MTRGGGLLEMPTTRPALHRVAALFEHDDLAARVDDARVADDWMSAGYRFAAFA